MSSDVQFNLRIPSELKEKVKRAAETSGRSINSEAQYRLEQSFEKTKSQESEIEELRKEIRNMNMTIHTLAEALVHKGNS